VFFVVNLFFLIQKDLKPKKPKVFGIRDVEGAEGGAEWSEAE
jgi:hypothetical protein